MVRHDNNIWLRPDYCTQGLALSTMPPLGIWHYKVKWSISNIQPSRAIKDGMTTIIFDWTLIFRWALLLLYCTVLKFKLSTTTLESYWDKFVHVSILYLFDIMLSLYWTVHGIHKRTCILEIDCSPKWMMEFLPTIRKSMLVKHHQIKT